MNLEPDEVARSVQGEMRRWADQRLSRIGQVGPIDVPGWRELVEFGLVAGIEGGLRHLDTAIGMLAAARGGLPGPVLEASLAVAAGSERAQKELQSGRIVTSVPPGPAGDVVVGWGGVADLVIDQADGRVLAEGPLPAVHTVIPMGHGLIHRDSAEADPLEPLRWLLAASLATGIGSGALQIATDYVKVREQFGRPLGAFQAVQFRLAEVVRRLDAAELMVFDAAKRLDVGHPHGGVSAALAWVYVAHTAAMVEKHTHQVCGAMGFTQEAGLVLLTNQLAWLRMSVSMDGATRFLASRRERGTDVPPSTVLAGFRLG